ncbi:uncharacterized protein LOC126838847 [Adelges cooleyi]|uniref:uncharacterized protein LOC126838847 n=1 Tax=Adelges cooleyi TaxID=133065 RepID=UPI00217F4104|nr:uncharacterized protein LOC126838847 [Adelges cooleyi]
MFVVCNSANSVFEQHTNNHTTRPYRVGNTTTTKNRPMGLRGSYEKSINTDHNPQISTVVFKPSGYHYTLDQLEVDTSSINHQHLNTQPPAVATVAPAAAEPAVTVPTTATTTLTAPPTDTTTDYNPLRKPFFLGQTYSHLFELRSPPGDSSP